MRCAILRLFLVAVLSASATALAQAPASVFVEELTSPELAAAIRAGKTTILVPIGGTEQNGPHMVLGKHNVRAKVLAGKIARELGNALVAPVIAYVPEGGVNPPTGHMRYPGTITVPADVYRKVLDSAARSFRLAGFRDIVFLGDHGDYQKDNEIVARQLDREWAGTPVRVVAIVEYYRAATDGFAKTLKAARLQRCRDRPSCRARRHVARVGGRPGTRATGASSSPHQEHRPRPVFRAIPAVPPPSSASRASI